MNRPFSDKRPIGPFAQGGSGGGLQALINYGKEMPEDMREDLEDAVAFHMEANGISVSDVNLGPEGENDSFMVEISDSTVDVDDLRSSAMAASAEIEDLGFRGLRDPQIELGIS